jgi:hypothetical protein
MTAYLSVELQRHVRERFANCCAYCRTAENLTATTFEFEHILPRCAGGETAFENLCLSCPMCNRYKSDQVLASDAVTLTEVPLFHPHKDQWEDHFAWSEEGTEVVGLTPIGRATVAALKMNRPQMIRVRRMWVAMSEHPPDLD